MADKSVIVTHSQIGTFNNYMGSNNEEPLKNITFNCFMAASCFKGRSDVINEIKERIESNKIVVLFGAPGIGKSETARHFSIQNLDYFNGNIIWMFAEPQENLKKCFKDLSAILGLKITDKDDVNVSLVYSKFKHSKCLFIFDNVENITTISKFLPCSRLHPTVKVILTSQIAPSDSTVAKIHLKALNVEDTLQILKDKLGDKYSQHPIEIWKDLGMYLEGIPLSTQIVAALINQELEKPIRITTFNLQDFIDSLKQKFINTEIPDSEITIYNKTVFGSIRFALERLGRETTSYSLDLLGFMAYLNADRIFHPDLLSVPSINESEGKLEMTLNKLVQYSLIQVETFKKGRLKIKVHRTIQLVSRIFDINERNGKMFESLMKIVVSTYKTRDLQIFRSNHFQSIFEFVKEEGYKNKSLEFFNENKALAESYIFALIKCNCHVVLRELLPKFKDGYITGNYNKILNKMLTHAIVNKSNNLATINFLINNGAKIDLFPNKSNGFHLASSWLSVELFDRLLETNDSKKLINSKDPWERTVLHILVQKCNEKNIKETKECMDYLISNYNADIFIRAEGNSTILHTACKNLEINLEFLKFLAESHNCKNLVNLQCDLGETPLHYFFENYHYLLHDSEWKQNGFEIVSYLVTKCKANILIQDNRHWNTLFYGCCYGTAEIIEFLLTTRDCCDLINIQDDLGEVAFTKLISNISIKETEKSELIKLFDECKMDFNTRNNCNKTLVEITEEMGLKKLSKEIQKQLERNLNVESTMEIE